MLAAYISALAGFLREFFNDAQDSRNALVEGTVRAVGLQFVIFDEVDAGLGQHFYLCRGLLAASCQRWV